MILKIKQKILPRIKLAMLVIIKMVMRLRLLILKPLPVVARIKQKILPRIKLAMLVIIKMVMRLRLLILKPLPVVARIKPLLMILLEVSKILLTVKTRNHLRVTVIRVQLIKVKPKVLLKTILLKGSYIVTLLLARLISVN